jgi:hypothetical protein
LIHKLQFVEMKNYLKYITVALMIAFFGCKDNPENPKKVIYDVASKVKEITRRDSTQIQIADLPIQMPGTDYLIHPVGDLSIYEKGLKTKYGTSSVNDLSFTISNVADYEITGYLQNLKFQKIGSDSIKPLSENPILIQTATYLKTIADRTKKQIMVYTLVDSDTNKDGKLDTNDIKALYMSDISGENFTKISPDFQEAIDWNVIDSQSRLYFRSIEDTNKNGQFDKKDVVHYNYINLAGKDWQVMGYEPI